jgi:acyl-CoA thioesterase-1
LASFRAIFSASDPARSGRRNRHGGSALLGQILGLVLLACGASGASGKTIHIVALGDSLTAGFQLQESAAFPSALERRLRESGFDVEVSNAGVSGDTAADGLARLDWSTPQGTDLVIVELGANDMLRNIPPSTPREALDRILSKLRDRKIPAVLVGMRSLANWGEQYREQFESIYPDLAARFSVPLFPFFLDGVSGHPELTLGDSLHPTVEGVQKIIDAFVPFLQPILVEKFGPPTPSSRK